MKTKAQILEHITTTWKSWKSVQASVGMKMAKLRKEREKR